MRNRDLTSISFDRSVGHMAEPCFYDRLTREIFMSLCQGSFLVTNTKGAGGRPTLTLTIAPEDQREQQWEKILKAGGEYEPCLLYSSAAEYWASQRGRGGKNPRGEF
jgi:hypothetical protein